MTTGLGICNLCRAEGLPDLVAIEDLVEHLHDKHGMDVEILTWPDGVPVVFDRTLEPNDFREEADGP